MALAKNRKGTIGSRGHTKQGIVVSDRVKKTVVIEMDTLDYFPKYRRSARAKSRIPVHNPEEINAKLGDMIEVAECRKISKTKAWIVTKIITRAKGIVIIDRRGGRALDAEAERLKKSEVIRDALPAKTPKEAEQQ